MDELRDTQYNLPIGTDCISRQAAIDICTSAIDLWSGQLGEGALVAVRNKIAELPSALGTNLAQVGTDCISRQAAIDALHMHLMYRMGTDSNKKRLDDWINNLPSAQPEIVRCKDCKYAEYIDDVKTLWCTECGQGRTVAPYDFCSYAERREVTT